jgi:hypothetical protein
MLIQLRQLDGAARAATGKFTGAFYMVFESLSCLIVPGDAAGAQIPDRRRLLNNPTQ